MIQRLGFLKHLETSGPVDKFKKKLGSGKSKNTRKDWNHVESLFETLFLEKLWRIPDVLKQFYLVHKSVLLDKLKS